MKRFLLTMMLVAVAALSINAATKYEINIAGVEVTSNNASRITGGDITGGYGVYNATDNILTLYNIEISRTGGSNYGIHNRKCDNLKIVFNGNAIIETEGSGLKLDRSTSIEVKYDKKVEVNCSKSYAMEMSSYSYYIKGTGTLVLKSKTSSAKECIYGQGTSSTTLYFQGAIVKAYSETKNALKNFKANFEKNSDLTIFYNSNVASVNNVSMSFYTSGGKIPAVLSPYGAYYSNNSIYNSSGSQVLGDNIYISDNYVAILNSSYFPDTNFRNALYNSYYSKGYITQSDVDSRTELNVANKSISSLTGLGIFTALKTLDCSSNQLTSLPTLPGTLQSLSIGNNKFTSLSLTYQSSLKTLSAQNNKSLTSLTCSYNALTSLNVSDCTALTSLDCKNNAMTYINTGNCTALQYLYLGGNKFTSMSLTGQSALKLLDVSNNYSLTYLDCSNNALTSLNVDGCNSLYNIDCRNNQLSTPIFSLPSGIQKLYIGGNKFTSVSVTVKNYLNTLDVSNSTNLTSLNCSYNALTNLNLTGCSGLNTLDCKNNQLTSLDVSQSSNIHDIYCNNNKLTSIKLPAWKAGSDYVNWVYNLYCQNNQLSNIESITNLKYSAGLKILDISNNKFTDIEPPALPLLQTLYCKNNTLLTEFVCNEQGSLTTLDMSGCTALVLLYCNENMLTSLNINGCSALENLECYDNQLTSLASLPASLKTLDCIDNQLTSLDVSGCTTLLSLDCRQNKLTSLGTLPNSLKYLDAGQNQFTSLSITGKAKLEVLSVSSCPLLTSLSCYDNALTTLKVYYCTALTSLDCRNNKLTTLNVSALSKLASLNARDNLLTSVNVDGCTALNTIQLQNNKLESLSVEGCNAMRNLVITRNKIKGNKMTELISSLCTIPEGSTGFFGVIAPDGENNAITTAQVDIARAKRWIPKKWENNGWVDIPGTSGGGILGDLDNSGMVDVEDVNAAINICVKLKTMADYPGNGDMDGNGMIDVEDVNAMINVILHLN